MQRRAYHPAESTKRSFREQPFVLFLVSVPLLMAAVLFGGATQREPDKDTTAIIQASYIYNIAKLVEWREPAMRQGPFVIAV